MDKNFIETPFIAFNYLTKGDTKDLTPEQIKKADEWAKDWEIVSIEDYVETETLSNKIVDSLIRDMDFDDCNDIDDEFD